MEDLDSIVEARIVREVPMAQKTLPSAALGTDGGGDIVHEGGTGVDGVRAYEGMFTFDLELLESPESIVFGSRVYVRFVHEKATIGYRLRRMMRQLFLKQFRM